MITWMKLGSRVYAECDGCVIESDFVFDDLLAGRTIFWHEGSQVTPSHVVISREEARADFEDWARKTEIEMPTEYQLKQWGL